MHVGITGVQDQRQRPHPTGSDRLCLGQRAIAQPVGQAFDAQLRAADPAIGYKDDQTVLHWLTAAGLEIAEVRDMPANNLSVVFERS